jgi:UDP-hydrolysing UDP-N-acetyl-D-glucosamine 2-epimerase
MIFSSCRADKYLLEPIKPADSDNILIVLGDRKETLLEAYKAVLNRTPIVHIHGGEETVGSYDNQFRHAITKMANLHLVVDEKAAKRVIQMGENPKDVFVVGSIGAEIAKRCPKQKKDGSILINYQPETLEDDPKKTLKEQFIESNKKINIIMPNSDRGSSRLGVWIKKNFTKANLISEVSMSEYHKLIAKADLCIGNSSSFIYEAPVLGTPVKLIGTRQQGREVKNYYRKGCIKNIIKIIKNHKFEIRKEFYDIKY